jgi:hypothetical protein
MAASMTLKIVKEVPRASLKRLRNNCMSYPSENKWLEIVNCFEKEVNFLNCAGVINGNHIRIIKIVNSSSLSYKYKKIFLCASVSSLITTITLHMVTLDCTQSAQILQFLKIPLFTEDLWNMH